MSSNRLDKRQLDVSQIFLTFIALVGDVEKTAVALDLDPEVVRKLADSEGWDLKIKRVCLMSKSGKPGDWERATHRALAYVQAHQIRGLIDRMISRFRDLSDEEMADQLSTVNKDGSRQVSARFFSDLTAAAQKTHEMGYAALGDTLGERKDRESDESDALNANSLHAAVIAALNNPAVKAVDIVAEVQKSQDEQVKQLAVSPAPPATP